MTAEHDARRASPAAPTSTPTSTRSAPYVDAGFDEVYVANMGPHYADMIAAYGEHVLPALRSRTTD